MNSQLYYFMESTDDSGHKGALQHYVGVSTDISKPFQSTWKVLLKIHA